MIYSTQSYLTGEKTQLHFCKTCKGSMVFTVADPWAERVERPDLIDEVVEDRRLAIRWITC